MLITSLQLIAIHTQCKLTWTWKLVGALLYCLADTHLGSLFEAHQEFSSVSMISAKINLDVYSIATSYFFYTVRSCLY